MKKTLRKSKRSIRNRRSVRNKRTIRKKRSGKNKRSMWNKRLVRNKRSIRNKRLVRNKRSIRNKRLVRNKRSIRGRTLNRGKIMKGGGGVAVVNRECLLEYARYQNIPEYYGKKNWHNLVKEQQRNILKLFGNNLECAEKDSTYYRIDNTDNIDKTNTTTQNVYELLTLVKNLEAAYIDYYDEHKKGWLMVTKKLKNAVEALIEQYRFIFEDADGVNEIQIEYEPYDMISGFGIQKCWDTLDHFRSFGPLNEKIIENVWEGENLQGSIFPKDTHQSDSADSGQSKPCTCKESFKVFFPPNPEEEEKRCTDQGKNCNGDCIYKYNYFGENTCTPTPPPTNK